MIFLQFTLSFAVNQCRDAANIDGDINAFMKVLDDDNPQVCLFYYEGPITMVSIFYASTE